jgi:hypothetical protein
MAADVEAEGHLIDSGVLSGIMDKIIEVRGSYEILNFDIGRTNDDPSRIKIRVTAPDLQRWPTCFSSSPRSDAAPSRRRTPW